MASDIHPFFGAPGRTAPLALAHQGGGDEEVENSGAAFAKAAKLGYRHLDIDLQATADGVLVAHHDDTLTRLTGLDGGVADRTWAELSEARLPNGEPLARFEDLLDAHPDAYWNIEVKNGEATGPTVDLVRRRDLDRRVCLNTFNDIRMRKIRKAAAGLRPAYSTPIVATLWLKVSSYLPLLPATPPLFSRADVTQAPVKDQGVPVLDRRFVDRAHRAGMQVIVWTINEADEMNRLLDIGVDGILTDAITELKTVLDQRGQWMP
jgi:glycerophosphoryl diester phosphodiesterase